MPLGCGLWEFVACVRWRWIAASVHGLAMSGGRAEATAKGDGEKRRPKAIAGGHLPDVSVSGRRTMSIARVYRAPSGQRSMGLP
jgi:hypothetical protein